MEDYTKCCAYTASNCLVSKNQLLYYSFKIMLPAHALMLSRTNTIQSFYRKNPHNAQIPKLPDPWLGKTISLCLLDQTEARDGFQS
jgi:hypothetical protein